MAPKNRQAATAAPSSAGQSTQKPQTSSGSNLRGAKDASTIAQGLWQNYVDHTPARVKQIDAFMAFLVVVGGLQFVYCVLAGNYVCLHFGKALLGFGGFRKSEADFCLLT